MSSINLVMYVRVNWHIRSLLTNKKVVVTNYISIYSKFIYNNMQLKFFPFMHTIFLLTLIIFEKKLLPPQK